MTSTDLPIPNVPIGIGHDMWSDTSYGDFEITFLLLHGINRVSKKAILSKSLVTCSKFDLQHIVQLLADRTVLEMLHHLDEKVLKQPILDRLEKALATMKTHAEVYSNSYQRSIATELKFFIDYIEGYVMGKPFKERYSNDNSN